ncbi:MAG TPA: SDR family oxidoreductase [Nocardioidaceae bacterium]|nr:SDR family oxidoreductase [Nocardioidaceae bacterium]
MAIELDLTGRVVLVTGGVRGVGLGVTRAFLDAGADVVTCSRTPPDSPVESGGRTAEHATADVRDEGSVRSLVDGIVARHGRIDVLVNNAGGAPYALAADASPRFHAKVVDLNLLSPLLVSQAANEVMQQQDAGGAIVMVSSISATRPSPGTAAYGAAKAGIDSLVKSLAVEWAPRVRLNAIDVGLVRTEQTDLHYGGEDGVAAIEATIPMGRLARPSEIGQVAAFLASPLASYVSGAAVAVHGGGEPPPFLAAARSASREPLTATTGKQEQM